ncbi:MAG: hypothetical protein WA530_09240 [Candidatus Acidiferrum sp.]
MTTILEETKAKHHRRLVELDDDRQKPQAKLAEKLRVRADLRQQLAALGAERPENKNQLYRLGHEIKNAEQEIATLESKLAKIDGEAATHHARILECDRPGDEARLAQQYEAARRAMAAARIAVAEYFLAGALHTRKYGEDGRLFDKKLREAFHEEQRTLRDKGWQTLDPVSTPFGKVDFQPMLPPARKS